MEVRQDGSRREEQYQAGARDCCHKELRPQLGRPAPLEAVLGHGIMAKRMGEWVTYGLRSLFLEWAGYCTKMTSIKLLNHLRTTAAGTL